MSLSPLQQSIAAVVEDHYLVELATSERPYAHCNCGWESPAATEDAAVRAWADHVASLCLFVYREADIRAIGAMQVDMERSQNVREFLDEQKKHYANVPASELVAELLRRDENLVRQGRQLQDGRTSGRLLRELMRGLLNHADAAQLRRLAGSKTDDPVSGVLALLTDDVADNRLLREGQGTTLNLGETGEERAKRMEGLADNPTQVIASDVQARPDVADSIRERRARNTAKALNETLGVEPGKISGLGD